MPEKMLKLPLNETIKDFNWNEVKAQSQKNPGELISFKIKDIVSELFLKYEIDSGIAWYDRLLCITILKQINSWSEQLELNREWFDVLLKLMDKRWYDNISYYNIVENISED